MSQSLWEASSLERIPDEQRHQLDELLFTPAWDNIVIEKALQKYALLPRAAREAFCSMADVCRAVACCAGVLDTSRRRTCVAGLASARLLAKS